MFFKEIYRIKNQLIIWSGRREFLQVIFSKPEGDTRWRAVALLFYKKWLFPPQILFFSKKKSTNYFFFFFNKDIIELISRQS